MNRPPRQPSNPVIREEVTSEHATRRELRDVQTATGLNAAEIRELKEDVHALKRDMTDVKEDMALIKAAVCKPDGKSVLDTVPTKLEKGGVAGLLLLLVMMTIARMLGLQLPAP